MKISTAGKYAVRIVVDIAKSGGVISLKEVATKQNISIKYAEQIASKLAKANIVCGQRGQDGGYRLAKNAEKISMQDILQATGDVDNKILCNSTCPRKNECAGGDVWSTLNGLINNYLGSVSVQNLVDKAKSVDKD